MTRVAGGIDLSPATIQGIKDGFINASFDQVLYLQGYYPVQQIFFTKNYLIPGLHINTEVGTVTPQNISQATHVDESCQFGKIVVSPGNISEPDGMPLFPEPETAPNLLYTLTLNDVRFVAQ